MRTKSASKTITRDPNWLGPAIPPGEILLEEFLKPMGIGQADAARRLGVSLNRLNEIVLGKRSITGDTTLRLALVQDFTAIGPFELRTGRKQRGKLFPGAIVVLDTMSRARRSKRVSPSDSPTNSSSIAFGSALLPGFSYELAHFRGK